MASSVGDAPRPPVRCDIRGSAIAVAVGTVDEQVAVVSTAVATAVGIICSELN